MATKKVTKKKKVTKSPKYIKNIRSSFGTKRLIVVGVLFAIVGSVVIYLASAATTITALSTQVEAAEGSGMVASRQHPGVFWWMRDGGPATAEKPRDAIYAMKFDANGNLQNVRGSTKFPSYLVSGSKNNNWEDIAIDDNNNVWIGDIGANICTRKDQKLLRIKEPDPNSNATTAIDASYTFRFPDPASGCNTWNSEAMFWLDGKMYIFAKTKNSPVYRVDLPSGTSGTATLTRLGTLAGGVSNISVSSISDDRTTLMVASHGVTRFFRTNNTSLRGDALVKDLIGRNPSFSAEFNCNCSTKAAVEGGSFFRGSRSVAYVSENKYIFFAKPAAYGDNSGGSTPAPAPNPPSADTTAPTAKITSPANGATVSGTIDIQVDAKDNVGITRSNLFYDDSIVIREGTSQGALGWGSRSNTRNLKDGTHTISVVVYDAAGNTATDKITVTVRNSTADTAAPSVRITSPANGATVSGRITIEVSASDNVGISAVNLFYDDTRVIREGTSQGTYGWGSRSDTTALSNGTHTISAVAYDAAGNQSVSKITVNVQN